MRKDDGFFPELFEVYDINEFDGYDQYPIIHKENDVIIPKKLVPYSKMSKHLDKDTFIHFYELDIQMQGIRRTIVKRIPEFQKCGGVITPDFSVFRDRPLLVQKMNTFLGRMIGAILQKNDVYVIPNIRLGDERTYEFCCKGLPKNSIIAVGTLGCYKKKIERDTFVRGFDYIAQELEPTDVVVYGKLPEEINIKYQNRIKFHIYETECSKGHH